MDRRILFHITSLFVFVLSLSLAPAEPFSPNFEADPEIYLSVDHTNPSPDVNGVSDLLNRFFRGKFAANGLTPFSKAKHAMHLAGLINETSLYPPFCKYGVYQQINVYRI